MSKKIGAYLLSADLLIILLIGNMFLTFTLFSKLQERISVLEEKICWAEDNILKKEQIKNGK